MKCGYCGGSMLTNKGEECGFCTTGLEGCCVLGCDQDSDREASIPYCKPHKQVFQLGKYEADLLRIVIEDLRAAKMRADKAIDRPEELVGALLGNCWAAADAIERILKDRMP